MVSLFLKFLMCFGFVCCAGLLLLMFQKADPRNMMPHWRKFQSWLKLLINFIQYLELVFVNKFEFPIMTLNVDIYFVFIVFFIIFFLPLSSISMLNFINYILITMRISILLSIFISILINYKKMTVNAYTYSYKITMNNI